MESPMSTLNCDLDCINTIEKKLTNRKERPGELCVLHYVLQLFQFYFLYSTIV